jgi:hypothetical protein
MQSSKPSKKSLKKGEEGLGQATPVSEAPKTRSTRASKPAKEKVEAISSKVQAKSPLASSGQIEPNEPGLAKVMKAGAGAGTVNGGIVDSVGVMVAVPATEAPATTSVAQSQSKPAVSREEVARLAYSYWEARGFTHGVADQDWLRAEAELLGRR